ncbi:MAG: leucine-rich repeat domain-containing protein [Muribaculaceae bacterium]|nr:leucine-rich repeat domain-containing protein [Muribaculaceae bacterium]
MTKYLLTLLVLLGSAFCGRAENFVSQGAGSLSTAFANPGELTTLSISGPIDARDIFFIDKSMTSLTSLDLSAAEITGYKGATLNGLSEYAAGTIPAKAFMGSGLTNVTLPAAQGTVIGDAAFAGSALKSIDLGGNLSSVGDGAFSNCPNLTEATVGAAKLGDRVFASSPKLATVTLASVSEVPASAFAHCTALTEINGTDGVTVIGDKAFAGCTALESFNFGAALTSVGAEAFEGSALTSADMQDCKKLESIGNMAFASATGLQSALMPEKAVTLGEGAFFGCTALKEITLPADMSELPAYVFTADKALANQNFLPEGTISVGNYAMKDMTGVKSVTLPESLEYIGDGAMEGMTGLESIDAKSMKNVPELGTDVWKGVDQSAVELFVYSSMSDEYGAADQWKDFKLMIVTGMDGVLAPTGDEETRVEGRFHGRELQLRSAGAEIMKVDVYNPSGALVVSATPRATEANISTEHAEGRIFIVQCTLSDGVRAAMKLVRP